MKCRYCNTELVRIFADLGAAPPSNSFLTSEQLDCPEVYYPLKVFVCDHCYLVQIDEFKKSTEIFSNDYVYFSSVSSSWLEHSKKYVEMITKRLRLNEKSQVLEIASNDGYLLQYVKEQGIPCLGIEPTSCTAVVAKNKGIPVIEDFFGETLARQLVKEGKRADLIIGNNVLAHVPNINDFVYGLKLALKPSGTVTMEFQHLMRLVECNQFDTIYHEHFSYLSLLSTSQILESHGLKIYDVEEFPTHGGSLRIYAKHIENDQIAVSRNVDKLLKEEVCRGMKTSEYYEGFIHKMERIKFHFLHFLLDRKKNHKTVVGYGAAGKGNTLLNYCGIKSDMIKFVCDRAVSKQGKFLPGSRIPVYSEEEIKKLKPDEIVIFPWNIRNEIETQLDYVRDWNGRFVTVVPELLTWT